MLQHRCVSKHLGIEFKFITITFNLLFSLPLQHIFVSAGFIPKQKKPELDIEKIKKTRMSGIAKPLRLQFISEYQFTEPTSFTWDQFKSGLQQKQSILNSDSFTSLMLIVLSFKLSYWNINCIVRDVAIPPERFSLEILLESVTTTSRIKSIFAYQFKK